MDTREKILRKDVLGQRLSGESEIDVCVEISPQR